MAKTVESGYGAPHKALRKQWEPEVSKGDVACRRCHELIAPDTEWDLGHDDEDRTLPARPEHASCNRATNGRAPVRRWPTSRDW